MRISTMLKNDSFAFDESVHHKSNVNLIEEREISICANFLLYFKVQIKIQIHLFFLLMTFWLDQQVEMKWLLFSKLQQGKLE